MILDESGRPKADYFRGVWGAGPAVKIKYCIWTLGFQDPNGMPKAGPASSGSLPPLMSAVREAEATGSVGVGALGSCSRDFIHERHSNDTPKAKAHGIGDSVLLVPDCFHIQAAGDEWLTFLKIHVPLLCRAWFFVELCCPQRASHGPLGPWATHGCHGFHGSHVGPSEPK
jgi:hypothetical protein